MPLYPSVRHGWKGRPPMSGSGALSGDAPFYHRFDSYILRGDSIAPRLSLALQSLLPPFLHFSLAFFSHRGLHGVERSVRELSPKRANYRFKRSAAAGTGGKRTLSS